MEASYKADDFDVLQKNAKVHCVSVPNDSLVGGVEIVAAKVYAAFRDVLDHQTATRS